jgi:Tol biopolymer transport system component
VSGRRRSHLLGAALAVAVLALVAALLLSRSPSRGHGIVFQAKVDGMYQLFRIDPDGSGLRQLTQLRFPHSSVPGVEQAVWSPDARRIVFDSDYRPTRRHVVSFFTIRPDGTGLERLPIPLGLFLNAPAWSPDGKTLAFDLDTDGHGGQDGIYVAGTDGADVHRLTRIYRPNTLDMRANWSPDGRSLVFREWSGDESVIVRIRRDGTGRRELTKWALDADNAKWSPDGTRIAFDTYFDPHPGKSANVFTMSPDGSGVRQLTHFEGGRLNAFVGTWSPDGRQLVIQVRGLDRDGPGLNQLFVLDAQTGAMRQLTHLPRHSNPGYPSWSPAG